MLPWIEETITDPAVGRATRSTRVDTNQASRATMAAVTMARPSAAARSRLTCSRAILKNTTNGSSP